MKAYVSTKQRTLDGKGFECFHTVEVECEQRLLSWQKRGLQYTATGYGKKIPTEYVVRFNGRFRRVYCCIFSNVGTLYLESKQEGEIITVDIER